MATEQVATSVRADQVGSLLRPDALLQARQAHDAARLSNDELQAVEDAAILDVLEMQRQVGVDVYTDGEYRRQSYMMGFFNAIEGFVESEGPGLEWHGVARENYPRISYPIVGGKLSARRRLAEHEAAFLKAHSPGPFKITLVSPLIGFSSYREGISDRIYASRGEVARELASILHDEVQALVDEGVPYVQMDAPGYTQYADPEWVARFRQFGSDPDKDLDDAIAADNAVLDGIQGDGVILGMHLCRGNSGGQWLASGGYDPIAEKLFNALHVRRFLLEYDSDRAGDFAPLRFLPKGKTVVLGLVTTKSGQLESQDVLLRRIEEAAQYVPMENLALSPQCGFASSIPGNPLTPDEQKRKLELVVDTVRRAWGVG